MLMTIIFILLAILYRPFQILKNKFNILFLCRVNTETSLGT
jgi:hypothetical protein